MSVQVAVQTWALVISIIAFGFTVWAFIWTGRREHRRWLLDRRTDAYIEMADKLQPVITRLRAVAHQSQLETFYGDFRGELKKLRQTSFIMVADPAVLLRFEMFIVEALDVFNTMESRKKHPKGDEDDAPVRLERLVDPVEQLASRVVSDMRREINPRLSKRSKRLLHEGHELRAAEPSSSGTQG